MSFDLLKILHEMDWMARTITAALLLMGIVSLAVFFERTLAYARSKKQSRLLAREAAGLVQNRDYSALAQTTTQYPASHLARVIGASLNTYLTSKNQLDSRADLIEVVKRELARQHEDAGVDLRRGLNMLASVGSVAPFVGLLGTVVGIIAAFTKISSTGSGGLGSVAGGISEALVVTALGLIIAIPAVLLFNRLSAQADEIHQGLGSSAGQLIDHLEFFAEQNEGARRESHAVSDAAA